MADNSPRRVTSSCEAELGVSPALEAQGVLDAADAGEQNGLSTLPSGKTRFPWLDAGIASAPQQTETTLGEPQKGPLGSVMRVSARVEQAESPEDLLDSVMRGSTRVKQAKSLQRDSRQKRSFRESVAALFGEVGVVRIHDENSISWSSLR